MRTSQRGMSLLVVVVVVVAATLFAMGLLRFMARETWATMSVPKQYSLHTCADAGRQMLMSKFKVFGARPESVVALNVPLDSTSLATARSIVVGGHYDTTGVTVAQVVRVPEATIGSAGGQDETNALIAPLGQPLKVIVHCVNKDATGAADRQLEVEFGVRFGIGN